MKPRIRLHLIRTGIDNYIRAKLWVITYGDGVVGGFGSMESALSYIARKVFGRQSI